MTPSLRRIAVAGASGFVGRALIASLAERYQVVALSRTVHPARRDSATEWRACDLFNLRETETALEGVDAAFYLVHSMSPAARLAQGTFEDFDLLCADNFARAAHTANVRHLVYLGGLLPPPEDGKLSRHLESRLEVEQTLAAHGVPLTTLRAGLIVGAGGSSFEMMAKLVARLPLMIAPQWTASRSQAIALSDVVSLLQFAVERPELSGQAYDVGGPDVMSYADTLRLTGEVLGKRTRVIPVSIRSNSLSLWWVSLITGAPLELVRPLVASLVHDLVARDGLRLQKLAGIHPMPLRAALEKAFAEQKTPERAMVRVSLPPPRADSSASYVQSVQRLVLPSGCDAEWVSAEYIRWLPHFARWFLRVRVDDAGGCAFALRGLRQPLLRLAFAINRSTPSHQLFYVDGGLLVNTVRGPRARLEFRSVLGHRWVIAAIHDFSPRLPWLLYKYTQAIFHLFVMARFGKHLARYCPAREEGSPRRLANVDSTTSRSSGSGRS